MIDFRGKGMPIDGAEVQTATELLGSGVAEIWAVIGVETSGCGFLPDRRPTILFERHRFSAHTGHQFDGGNPDISNTTAGGYGAGGAAQYERLARAMALDERAALLSTSWGIGQVMGENAPGLGYTGVEDMVSAMCGSEGAQLEAMARFISVNGLAGALRSHDWTRFARGYNGPNYTINKYDTRLAASYQNLQGGALPDLAVRSAQLYLTYLGYHPRGIDGIMGRFTRAALNEFQAKQGIPTTDHVDDETLAALEGAVGGV